MPKGGYADVSGWGGTVESSCFRGSKIFGAFRGLVDDHIPPADRSPNLAASLCQMTLQKRKTQILENKATVQEANNELFIFRKEKGKWKIHRYVFAPCHPPAA